ncbi:cytochrome P450 [Glomus cerebriforme]|uniref:Cytochrome P450 n=1 Tax=Glomus cerebriforme TaxID=658196 RepID=A0A397SCY1_9GLOM|nr:cytochrome P450 [Glomus cerebriforme]
MFLIIFLTLLLIIIVHYYVRNKLLSKDVETIPYVSGLPMMWALIKQKPHDEVEEVMSKASGEHEIYLTRFGPFKQVSFVSPECVKDLLMASEDVAPKIEFHPGNAFYDFFGKGLPFSNGDTWKTYRKLANPAFNSALNPNLVGETTLELFILMQRNLNDQIDIFAMLQRITIEILGKLAFGYQFGCLKSAETPHIIKVYKDIISFVENPIRIILPFLNKLPLESNRKFFASLEEFDKFIFDIIEKKKIEIKNNNNKENVFSGRIDLLTSMLELGEKEGIDTDIKQLRDEMVNNFVAGHDTTALALSTSLYYLAKYPEMQERARAEVINILGDKPIIPTSEQLKEMKYINAIIKESLRIHPPSPVINLRKPLKPIKVGSHVIPKDTLCIANIWQIHHHPKYWENPNQYDPDRFLNGEKRHPFAWIPFSAGHRNCIGQNFSLMEQRVILSMFLLKYEWTLPKDSINKEKMILDPQFLLRPVKLELLFAERN